MIEFKQGICAAVPVLKPDAKLPAASELSRESVMDSAERVAFKNGVCAAEALSATADAIVIPLAAESPEFCEAVLEHFAQYAALGIALAAKAANAGRVIIYGDSTAVDGLKSALSENGVAAELVSGDATPVLREESALLAALEGRPVRSELLKQPLSVCGFEGKPTLVLELETAVWLAACVSDKNAAQGKLMLHERGEALLELNLGTPVADLAQELGLSAEKPFLFGGCTGLFADVSSDKTVAYNADFDTLLDFADNTCMAQVGRQQCSGISETSCGKCVLCREGSWQFAAIFTDITEGRGKRGDLELVDDIGGLIAEGAFCDFGRKMVRVPMTLAELGRRELETHIVRKSCPVGACAAFSEYVIDPALCTGCGDCLDECPEDAIEGKPGFIHMIDPVMCTKCGKCVSKCPEGAIVIATGRMKLPKKLTRVGRFK